MNAIKTREVKEGALARKLPVVYDNVICAGRKWILVKE